MDDHPIYATREELDRAIEMLGDLLGILGWTMIPPNDEVMHGTVIGTPEYIEGYKEMISKRKEDFS